MQVQGFVYDVPNVATAVMSQDGQMISYTKGDKTWENRNYTKVSSRKDGFWYKEKL